YAVVLLISCLAKVLVIVQLCQCQNITGNRFYIRFTMLDCDVQRDGCFPAVVGGNPRFEATAKKIPGPCSVFPECSSQDWHTTITEQPRAEPVGTYTDADEFTASRASTFISSKFLVT